ncbi:GNAT family N-acetyltransferase [Arthrobacter sp. VKM Ac-2550]|uniref:GNAT family N-acetyltransferase n=1 Tax=Crystallibacter permensis TaxID=1938888 RepID=UPI002226F1D6|nr:GNAT family N-acetyltransferase [Arthrobacter sp. VKM Ac-2550]MCW2132347.1 putative acetyltransferase [Arthrobacter sp. VKM Ac-2550]
MTTTLRIGPEEVLSPDIRQLLQEHLSDMHSISPAESAHALDVDAFSAPGIDFWTVRDGQMLLGCGALKELTPTEGEIKSMCTASGARRRGVATLMLAQLLEVARSRGYERVSLETGSDESIAPARRLYRSHGFIECPPFADYSLDPHSVFMTLCPGASLSS